MNIFEMHERVDFWADTIKSPRYSNSQRNNALNIAIDSFVKDRYDNIKKGYRSGYSFEMIERVKEELYTIMTIDYPALIVRNQTPTPPNFLYHIVTFVEVNGSRVLSVPKTYEENDLHQNSFTKPSLSQPIHRRTPTGFQYDVGTTSINRAFISYLQNPAIMKWKENAISASPSALFPGKSYIVISGTVSHGLVNYSPDDVFTAVTTGFTGSGIVNEVVNCNLPTHTHEEICKIATSVLLGTFENYNKSEKINQESRRS